MTFSIHVAGWTLVHFLWQGALVGLVAAAALRLLHSASAQTRYAVACGALAVMLASPVITARLLSVSDPIASTGGRSQAVSFDAAAQLKPSATPMPAQNGLSAQAAWRAVEALLPLVVMAWLVGVAFLLLRLTGGWWCVRRLHREALAMTASRWQVASEQIASRLLLPRGVHVVDSPLVDTPTALGWLRPVVLLPIAVLTNLAPAQIEAILAHIRRHDYLVNLLQTVAETLLFYHPAVWWVSACIRAEREHCCDDVAVEVCGDALSYVAALAEIESSRTSPAGRTEETALALAATGGSLLDRVRRILRVPVDKERSSSSAVLTTAMVALLLIIVAGGRQHLPALAHSGVATTQSQAPDAVGAAFEVASIKPVGFEALSQRNGFMCVFDGRTFRFAGDGQWLIACAYSIPAARAQLQIVGVPEWLAADLFEIVADSAPAPGNVRYSWSEGLVMLRTLLADRFKLAVHRDTKEMPTYTLVMARADGKRRPTASPNASRLCGLARSRRTARSKTIDARLSTLRLRKMEPVHYHEYRHTLIALRRPLVSSRGPSRTESDWPRGPL